MKTEKRINKWLIGAVIGSTILGISGLSMTPKGQSFIKRWLRKVKNFFSFLGVGYRELLKSKGWKK